MKLDSSLFDTFQQLRSQQQNRKAELLLQYENKMKPGTKPGTTPGTTPGTKPGPIKPDPNSKPPTHVDFGNMSSKQLNDWLKKGIASGKIAPEQESAFKAMIYSATSGDSKNENNLVNFSEKAKEGLQSAMRRKDSSSMLYWANAMSTMKKFQGEKLPVKTS
jgi:hypothetical protein